MTPLKPSGYCRIILIGDMHISEYAVLYASCQCFDNGWCRTEIHIGYPKRQNIFTCGHAIPLIGIGPPAGDDFIKVVFHSPCTLFGKAGEFVSKQNLAVGGSLYILIDGDGTVLVCHDTA